MPCTPAYAKLRLQMQIDVWKKPLLVQSIVDVSKTKCQTRAKYLSLVSRVCLSSFFFFLLLFLTGVTMEDAKGAIFYLSAYALVILAAIRPE